MIAFVFIVKHMTFFLVCLRPDHNIMMISRNKIASLKELGHENMHNCHAGKM